MNSSKYLESLNFPDLWLHHHGVQKTSHWSSIVSRTSSTSTAEQVRSFTVYGADFLHRNNTWSYIYGSTWVRKGSCLLYGDINIAGLSKAICFATGEQGGEEALTYFNNEVKWNPFESQRAKGVWPVYILFIWIWTLCRSEDEDNDQHQRLDKGKRLDILCSTETLLCKKTNNPGD